MVAPKIFVSSTCYDLNIVRGQLRNFILSLGYDPIMSDHSDVLYDPRDHTHTSCLKEIPSCDLVIVIIGSRFGGKGVPEAVNSISLENIRKQGFDVSKFPSKENFSITQAEVLKALEVEVPLFAFVDNAVYHDHNLYEKNKGNEIIVGEMIQNLQLRVALLNQQLEILERIKQKKNENAEPQNL